MLSYNKFDFYKSNKRISSLDIHNLLKKLIIEKNIHHNFEINHICSLENNFQNCVVFINQDKELKILKDDILVITNNKNFLKKYNNCILVTDMTKSFNLIADYLYIHDDSIKYNDDFNLINNSSISKLAKVDPSAKIGRNCLIGKGVVIGKNSIIKNNVVIKNSILSDNVIISDNTTIGCTGFGFDLANMGSTNLSPHLGIVHIDENVSIGSNC